MAIRDLSVGQMLATSAFGALTISLSGYFYPFMTPIVGFGVLATASSVGADIASKQYVPRFGGRDPKKLVASIG